MIHHISCEIVLPAGVSFFSKPEPPIPTDEQIAEVFGAEWQQVAMAFVGRAAREEGKTGFDRLTPQDLLRYGLKFAVVQAAKVI